MLNLLCLSNGVNHGGTLFEFAYDWIGQITPPGSKVLFIPFAEHNQTAYIKEAAEAFDRIGVSVSGVSPSAEWIDWSKADAVVVGGGNCFRLLDTLYKSDLFEQVSTRVRDGLPYVGASAGSNIACPTMMTTNDMPIVVPRSLVGFGFLTFQINAHYVAPKPGSTHMGETRDERIREYHEEQTTPVLGLREGTGIRCHRGKIFLRGPHGARLFRKGEIPIEIPAESSLVPYL